MVHFVGMSMALSPPIHNARANGERLSILAHWRKILLSDLRLVKGKEQQQHWEKIKAWYSLAMICEAMKPRGPPQKLGQTRKGRLKTRHRVHPCIIITIMTLAFAWGWVVGQVSNRCGVLVADGLMWSWFCFYDKEGRGDERGT